MCAANDFNPDADAKALRKAMKGIGKSDKNQKRPLGCSQEGLAVKGSGRGVEAFNEALRGEEDSVGASSISAGREG